MPESLIECISLKLGCNPNMIKVEIKVVLNAGIYLFFEKGTRGGVSFIFKRYSKGNSKYLKFYDSKH